MWRAGRKHLQRDGSYEASARLSSRPRAAGRGIREADLTDTDIPMNPVEASAVVRERARRECSNTLAVWEEGINLLIRGIDPLRAMKYQRTAHLQEPVQFAL